MELENINNLIEAYLEQITLLEAQPHVNNKAVEIARTNLFNVMLRLNDIMEKNYRTRLVQLEDEETMTIRDELLKRERILELSKIRENAFEKLFNSENPEHQRLYKLFEDIRTEQSYERVFHESDYQLVLEQLKTIDENKRKEQILKEEYKNNLRQINSIQNNIKSFREYNGQLMKEYENFININEIAKINEEEALNVKLYTLEREQVMTENIELLKTAQNIEQEQFRHLNQQKEDNSLVLEEANELLFMAELGKKMQRDVRDYNELKEKLEDIVSFVTNRETELMDKYPNISYPNEFSYRTIFFMNDLKLINDQINAPQNVETLQQRNKQIKRELNNLNDNVKGLRELKEIIYNKDSVLEEEIIIFETEEKDNVIEHGIKEKTYSVEIVEQPKPQIIGKMENIIENIIEDKNLLEIIKIEKASQNLLKKIDGIKDQLKKLKEKSSLLIVSGILVLLPLVGSNVYANDKQNITITPQIEIVEHIKELKDKIFNSIGDKVNISDGAKYYKDAKSAQLDENSFETGKGTYALNAGSYNVNRIALMEKDKNGNPTGNILATNTTPGINAKELAKAIGLEEEQYDVMIHIGSGDDKGNYKEAPLNSRAEDDLCWLQANDQNIKVIKSAEEVLKDSGKGFVR